MNTYIPGTAARSFDEIKDLSPWSVEQYLLFSGWIQSDVVPQKYGLWTSADDDASIMLPYDTSLRDFVQRYTEALDTLTALTGLEGESLALEVVAARQDIFLLRADQATRDGSIPFLEARRLIDGVQTLLTSAAASAIRPRASTAGNKPSLVNEFMREDVRLGHTLHGSFVITVLASDAREDNRRRELWERGIEPQTSQPGETSDEDAVTSFPRLVMSNLASGLQVARDLLEGTSTVTIDDAIASGVTLQMLESVKSMGNAEGLHSLDMAFRWAKAEPKLIDTPDRIQVTHEQAASAEPYIERFKKKPDVEEDYILGKVIRLERPEGSEDGQVVVEGTVGKNRRKVKVPLSGEAYRLAISAHDASDPVTVTGTFTRNSRGWRMEGHPVISKVTVAPPSSSET